MDEEQKTTQEQQAKQSFTPDFGNTFDDYGEYQQEGAERPSRSVPRPKRLKRIRLPSIFWWVLAMAVAAGLGILLSNYGWKWADDVLALSRPDAAVEITINEFDDLDAITTSLKEAGAIEYEWLFKLYCKFSGSEDYFDPGVYTINLNYDYHALVNNLVEGAGSRGEVTVMIVEGSRCSDIFELLENKGVCSREKLEQAAAEYDFDFDFLKDVPSGAPNRLEGFLFPDTYYFYLKDEPENVLKKMLQNFQKRMSEEGLEQISSSPYSMRELVTMASIVEGEAASDEERPIVASVMYNRLNNWENPVLGMDSTVYYGCLLLGEKFSTEIDSPYNTYLKPGLPAGPINNPGITSIRAVLQPAQTNYYYFATSKDGFNKFFADEKSFTEFISSDDFKPIIPG